jgi:hypothetical protein
MYLAYSGAFLMMLSLLLGVAEVRAPATALASSAIAPERQVGDSLHARVREELRVFTNWLETNGVRGYIGEVGWPNDADGDGVRWNALAEAWFQDADASQLWVTVWDTGQRRCDYRLAVYKTLACGQPPLAQADVQAQVVEAHPATSNYRRGINVTGASAGAPFGNEPTSSFSNVNRGVHGEDYLFDEQSTFDFLAGRGIELVRLPFRWERIQPRLGEPLEAAELQRLKDAVQRARQANLGVILVVQNFGAYYLHDGTRGVRRTIGSAEVTEAHFVELWLRLSREFRDEPTVLGYGLMNEPFGMGAPVWEAQSQVAVNAIRDNGDAKVILVPGYAPAGVAQWTRFHPHPWIVDRLNNVLYEAHQYFDRRSWGTYDYSYSAEVSEASSRGYGLLASR